MAGAEKNQATLQKPFRRNALEWLGCLGRKKNFLHGDMNNQKAFLKLQKFNYLIQKYPQQPSLLVTEAPESNHYDCFLGGPLGQFFFCSLFLQCPDNSRIPFFSRASLACSQTLRFRIMLIDFSI